MYTVSILCLTYATCVRVSVFMYGKYRQIVIQLRSLSLSGLRNFCIAAETTTASSDNVVASEAESTSVVMAANDAVTSSSVDDGVSTEVSTHPLTKEASSSLPPVSGKILVSNRLSLRYHIKTVLALSFTVEFFSFFSFYRNTALISRGEAAHQMYTRGSVIGGA